MSPLLRGAGAALRRAALASRPRPPTWSGAHTVGMAPGAAAGAAAQVRRCITVTFVKAEGGGETSITAKAGQTVLEAAHAHNIDIEGACGGECACSTCHIVLDQEAYDSMPEPDDDEADMLDLAAHVCDTSRLGCQIKLQKERDDGLRITIPVGSVNLLE